MLVYTVCHLKNLKNAFVLGDSIKKFHPDSEFVIGLVDKKSSIPSNFTPPYSIIEIDEIGIDLKINSWAKYNSDEFLRNTKPFFAKFFFEKFPSESQIIFIAPTQKIYQKLDFIEGKLVENSILLVPQLLNSSKHPDEKQALNSGVFHAGFFGLKRSDETDKFLDWWASNTSKKGFINLEKGMNAEQLWLELVPTIFETVYIEKNQGLNVGKWNLSERTLQMTDNQYFVNGFPLISVDFENIKKFRDYQEDLEKYKKFNFDTQKPHFGIFVEPKSLIKTKTAIFLQKIISSIDKFFDKF